MAAVAPGSAGYQGTRQWYRTVAIEIGQFLQNLAGIPITITSPTSLDVLQVNSGGTLVNRQPLGAEANTTPVTGANDTAIGNSTRYYTFFTLPTTAPFFQITGIEWLNGTVINGNVEACIELVDANPPVSAQTTLMVWTRQVAQSGASSVQRVSTGALSGPMIAGGSICGAFIWSSSATARFQTATVSSNNNTKAVAFSSVPAVQNGTAWSAGTEEAQIKVYYKPFMGV